MLSERTWRGETVVRFLLGLVIVICIGQLLIALVQTFDMSPTDRRSLSILIATLSMQGAVIFLASFFLKEEGLGCREVFGLDGQTWRKAILVGALAALIVVPIAWLLAQVSSTVLELLQFDRASQELVQDFRNSSTEAGSEMALLRQRAFFALSVIIVAPIGEEILFRGIIYRVIKSAGFPLAALWLSALLFAALHTNLMSFVPFVVLGLVLARVYERTGTLLSAIVTHSLFNTANFLYMLYEEPINQFLEQLT